MGPCWDLNRESSPGPGSGGRGGREMPVIDMLLSSPSAALSIGPLKSCPLSPTKVCVLRWPPCLTAPAGGLIGGVLGS
eukprot:15459892-Alexandrium_andersonii.AAC.1